MGAVVRTVTAPVRAVVDVVEDVVSPVVDVVEDVGRGVVDVVEDVAEFAEDAFEWVGETVVDAAEWTYDTILEPVVAVGEGIIQGAIDDPLGTAIMIAAASTGNPFIIAAAAAARTAINGGSIEEMLISAGTSYLGAEVGSYVGDYIGSTVASEAGATAGRVAAQSAAGATRGAITAAATGENIEDAALRGAVNGAASAGVSSLGSYVRGQVSPVPTVDAGAAGGVDINVDPDSFNSTFTTTYGSVSNELSSLVDGFDSLPDVIQDTITSGAAAAITSYIATGEVNEDLVAAQMFNAAVTAQFVQSATADSEFFDPNTIEGRTRAAFLTQVTNSAVASAFTGADPTAILPNAFTATARSSLNEQINETTGGGLFRAIDEITGLQEAFASAFGIAEDIGDDLETIGADLIASRERGELLTADVEAKANAVDAYVQNGQTLINRANDLQGQRSRADVELDVLYERKDQLDSLGRSGTWSAEYQAEYDTLISDINSQVVTVNSLNTQYNEAISAANAWTEANGTSQEPKGEYARLSALFNSSMDALEAEIATQNSLAERWTETNTAYNTAINSVEEASDALTRNNQYIDQLTAPATEAAQKAVVDTITADPNTGETQFNADEYRQMYGLSEDENPYTHWLSNGRTNYISEDQRETARNGALQQAAYAAVISNPDSLSSAEQISILADTIIAEMSEEQVASLGITPENVNEFINSTADELGITADNARPEYNITRDEGVTDMDIASGRAGIEYVRNEAGDSIGINFSLTPQLTESAVFDPRLNRYVQPVYNQETGDVQYLDAAGQELVEQFRDQPSWAGVTGGITFGDRGGLPITVRPMGTRPPTLTELSKSNPLVAIDAAGEITVNNEALAELDWVNRQLVLLGKGAAELAKAQEARYEAEGLTEEQKEEARYLDRVFMGEIVLGASSELAKAYSDVVSIFGYNPTKQNLARTAEALKDMAEATTPQEYREKLTKAHRMIGDATGVLGTAGAIIDAVREYPLQMGVEYIGKEVAQAIPEILLGGGAGALTRRSLGATRLFAQDTIRNIGRNVAWTTGVGLQTLETVGATAGETWEEVYNEALAMGVPANEAEELAQNAAITNALVAGITELTVGRLLNVQDLVTAGIGKGVRSRIDLDRAMKGIVAATGSELVEEVSTNAVKIDILESINPAITQPGGRYEDYSGVLTAAGILGAASGMGTAGSIVVGDTIYNAIANGTYTGGEANIPAEYWGEAPPTRVDTGDPMGNLLVTYNPTLNAAYTNAQSDNIEVRAAGEAELQNLLGWNQYFDDSGQVIDLTQDEDGSYSYNVTSNILNAANDNAYTTPTEVREAYDALSETAPIQLSDTQLLGYTGQRADENLVQDLRTDINRGYIQDLLVNAGLPSTDADVDAALTAAIERYDVAPDAMLDTGIGSRLAFQYNPSQAVTDIVASQLGRPGQLVTEEDINAITGIIARQDTATEPLVYTDEETNLDINRDNVIDVNDQIALQQLRQQQQTGIYTDTTVSIDPSSPFAPTGVYAELERQRAAAARQRQRANVGQLVGMLQGAQGPKMVVESPEVKSIDYYYNPYEAESIFATPKQAGIFGSELAGDNQNSADDDFLSQLRRATGGI